MQLAFLWAARCHDKHASRSELTLLRSCLGVPNLVYAMRTLPPHMLAAQLQRADGAILAALQNIVGDVLSLAARTQAALPICRGGMGVRQALQTAEAAYLSSFFGTRELTARILGRAEDAVPTPPGVPAALAVLNGRAGAAEQPWTVELLAEQRPSQELLLEGSDKAAYEGLKAAGTRWDRARLMGVSMHHAGSWLSVVPSWRYRMAHLEHIVACKFWLGMHCYPPDLQRACPACRGPTDTFGYHSTCCDTYKDRTSRHNSQCDLFASSARAAAKSTVRLVLPPRQRDQVVREHPHLLPGTALRPGDVTVAAWHFQLMAAFDFTVVSPFVADILPQTAERRGFAAERAETLKEDKSYEACRLQSIRFVPMAVETTGGWGQAAIQTFRVLSSMLSAQTGRSQSEELSWMYQRHSVALQRDNARMILSRAPQYDPL